MNTCPCENPPTRSWLRWATTAEVETFRTDPDNPSVQPHETEATVPVYGCDTCAPADSGIDYTTTHEATCTAPPTCDCQVAS